MGRDEICRQKTEFALFLGFVFNFQRLAGDEFLFGRSDLGSLFPAKSADSFSNKLKKRDVFSVD